MKIIAGLLLGCVCAVLPAASPDVEGFIRDWLLLGPYPSALRDGVHIGLDTDFLAPFGGEGACRAQAGMEDKAVFVADVGKLIAGIGSANEWGLTETHEVPIQWEEFHVKGELSQVILDKRHALFDDHIVTYALCYIESPEAREIKLRVGSDDDCKVFVNGVPVGRHAGSQGIVPDNFIFDAHLKRGLNTLLFKCVDRILGYGFCLAVSDREDRPMTDLKIRLDNPLLAAAERHSLPAVPEEFDRGVWAGFQAPVLAGRGQMTVQFGSEQPMTGRAELLLMRDGKEIAATATEVSTGDAKYGSLAFEHELEPGVYELILRYGDAECRKRFEIHSPERLAARRDELRRRIAACRAEAEELRHANTALSGENERLKQQYRENFAVLERYYEALRRAALAGVEPQERIAYTAAPGAERMTLNLNGDNWKISRDGTNWRKVRLPRTHFNPYYRGNYFPVKPADPKNRYGAIVKNPGFDHWEYDDSCNWPEFVAELEFDLPSAGAYTFLCDQVNGKISLELNDVPCGEWAGSLGLVRIPLKSAKAGRNRLRINFISPQNYFHFYNRRLTDFYGIRGTMSIETAQAAVLTRDVTIKTSWRKGTLDVSGTLENRGDADAPVTLHQYVVRDGTIVFRLPEKSGTIPAGGTLELTTGDRWADPEVWGIGGKYGDPVLYTLVSDLHCDGKLIDRHTERFGFREFWIGGSAFFLNGRHILLQGDNGLPGIDTPKSSEITFDLLRRDNINIIRSHDGEFASPDFLRTADRLGMLAYPNMYPILLPNSTRESLTDFISYEDWLKHPLHELNLRNYREWLWMLRNHPSVVVLSTDNEIWTQSWDTPEREALNIRNDRLGAFYEKYVKSLDPARVMTRNGDVGTWGFHEKFREDPPCDTANYHYPDFNIDKVVRNWQSVFGFRPVIYGETLYYSYGAWDQWIGAIPTQVANKAARVREVASLYRELLIPGQIYMGLSHDGFLKFDDTGRGNPWGVKASDHDRGEVPGFPGYPWAQVHWPAASGPAAQREFVGFSVKYAPMFNWFDSRYPSHVRNEVNDAYRESLVAMPPLAMPDNAECIVELGEAGAGVVGVAASRGI